MQIKKNNLRDANKLMREGNYKEALDLYEGILAENPELKKLVRFNLQFVKRKLGLEGSSEPAEDTTDQSGCSSDDMFEMIWPSHMENYTYITFDVWDTVLRRVCDPDEIKLRTARALWLTCSDVTKNYDGPIPLFWLRKEAERNVADQHFEYKVDEAFNEYIRLCRGENQKSDSDLTRNLVDLEIKIEKTSTYPDKLIKNLIESLSNKKVFAISDFYHSGHNLSCILEHHDLLQHFDKVYVSSDFMKTKRAGHLFDHVFKSEGITASTMFHIGDNPLADYEQATKKDIKAFLYENLNERPRLDRLNIAFEEHLKGIEDKHYKNILSCIKADEYIEGTKNMREISDCLVAGKVISSIVVGFVLEIMEQAIRRNCENVFFFSREGELFKRVYETLVELDVYDIGNYPKPKMLYVSRRATFAASLSEISINEMMRMWNMYSTQSVDAMARSLNFDATIVSNIAKRFGLDPSKPIQYPWLDDNFKRFFHSEDFQNYANNSVKTQRELLTAYLRKSGIDIENKNLYLMVDIGWRGTIQDNICGLIRGNVHGVYLALKNYINQQPLNSSKSAYLSDDNIDFRFDLDDVASLEFIFNAPGGSVIGYNQDFEPIKEVFESEERVIKGPVADLQEGIIQGVSLIGKYVRNHGLVAKDLLALSRHIVSCYNQNPPECIADAFYNLEHNETFGTGDTDFIGCQFDPSSLIRLEDAALHAELSRIQNRMRWSSSVFNTRHFNRLFSDFTPNQYLNIPLKNSKKNLFSIVREEFRKDTVSIFAPRPLAGSGGHRTIFNFAKGLTRRGFEVNLMLEGYNDDLWYVENELSNHGITIHTEWFAGIKPTIALATIAHSANYVREFHSRSIGAYFVQDYEAEFNPLSDGYVRGQNSYAQGLAPICIGHWLPHLLNKQFGIGSAYGGLGVDTSIYYPIPDIEKKSMVAFLYQPEKWRRMPETCISALSIVKQRRPQTEIVLYGSDAQPNLPFEATQRGLIHDLSELNKIYNEASVGLCLSLTNPSRIPIEYMASGCVPVDLYRYNNLFDNVSGVSLLAYQSEASIAEAILMLLENPEDCEKRRINGINLASQRTIQWEVDTAVNSVEWLTSGRKFSELSVPKRTYVDPPIFANSDLRTETENFCNWQLNMSM